MDISIRLEPGLSQNQIEFIQHIEKELDGVLVQNGFARTTTTKSDDSVAFNYRQFGIAVGPSTTAAERGSTIDRIWCPNCDIEIELP